jgi:hypothetical protein
VRAADVEMFLVGVIVGVVVGVRIWLVRGDRDDKMQDGVEGRVWWWWETKGGKAAGMMSFLRLLQEVSSLEKCMSLEAARFFVCSMD